MEPRPPLRRPLEGRIVAGVAAGVARHLRLPVSGVRVALAGLVAMGGAGAVGYLLLWALVPADASGPGTPAGTPRPGRSRWRTDAESSWQLLLGVALLVLGAALLAERAGLPIRADAVLPAALALAGVVVVWGQLDAAERGRWLAGAGGDTREGLLRLGAGVLLSVAGVALLAGAGADPGALRSALLAAFAVLAGVGLLVAPWAVRLWRDLQAERAARVREAERAEVAAHLHDSVLQTLALIQRRTDDPDEVARLARGQERELRAWLYAGRQAAMEAPATVASEVRRVLAEVEDRHGVPVDVVVVGDAALDRRTEALVLALREAALNAVRHGRPPVQVYLECSDGAVVTFVRDRGDGFDLDDVPADRMGVRESVLGRMARVGGTASVRRFPGGGTEVAVRVAGPAGAVGAAGAAEEEER